MRKKRAKSKPHLAVLMKPLFIVLVLFPSLCIAGLGDTFDQCVEKFGTDYSTSISRPFEPCAVAKWTNVSGFDIIVAWMPPEGSSGPADYIYVTKRGGSFTDEQLQAIISANSNNMQWKSVPHFKADNSPVSSYVANYLLRNIAPKDFVRTDGATLAVVSSTATLKSARLIRKERDEADENALKTKAIPHF